MTTQKQKQLNDQHKNDIWSYLKTNGDPYFKVLADIISSHGVSVLDVGCGEALVLKHLPKPFHYVGVDLSDFIISRNIQHHSNYAVYFYVNDMFKPNLPGQYNVILFAGAFTILSENQIYDLVKLYAKKYKPKYILIADLYKTDLSLVRKNFEVISLEFVNFPFIKSPIAVGTPQQINNRQILLIKV